MRNLVTLCFLILCLSSCKTIDWGFDEVVEQHVMLPMNHFIQLSEDVLIYSHILKDKNPIDSTAIFTAFEDYRAYRFAVENELKSDSTLISDLESIFDHMFIVEHEFQVSMDFFDSMDPQLKKQVTDHLNQSKIETCTVSAYYRIRWADPTSIPNELIVCFEGVDYFEGVHIIDDKSHTRVE